MSIKSKYQIEDFFTLTKTTLVDLPLAGMLWRWGIGNEATVTEAAWTGYDAGVRLATAAVDNLYRLPLTTTLLKNAAPALLRWQYMSNAVIEAASAGVWRSVGLSTTRETQALRENITHLAATVYTQRREQEALISIATRVAQALEVETPLTPPSVSNGFALREQLFQPKTTSASH